MSGRAIHTERRADVDEVLDPRLARSVDVWTISLSTLANRMDEFRAFLAPDELARAARFVFERDRRRFILARSALRLLVGRYLDLAPNQVTFQYGPHGKPELVEAQQSPPGLQFNVSHSGDHCLFAVAWGRHVGVDIEVIRSDVDCLSLAERFFSRREYEDLRHASDEDRPARFFQYWTCKEAYLKSSGLGISSGLAVEGQVHSDGSVHFDAGGMGARSPWVVRRLSLTSSVAAAVGAEGEDWTMVVSELVTDPR